MAPEVRAKKIFYFIPALFWLCLLFYFSLLPGDDIPGIFKGVNDLFIHCGIYFVLSSVLYLGLIRYNFKNPISRVKLWFLIIFSMVYGASLEIIQEYFIPSRTGDWWDFIANTLGSLLSVLVLWLLHRRLA